MAKTKAGSGCAVGCIGVLMLGIGGLSIAPHFDRKTYNVNIIDVERVQDRAGGSSKYLVFTEDTKTGEERVFENVDSIAELFFDSMKFSSSNLQTKLKKAEKNNTPVSLDTYGWRVPILSMYENIIQVNPHHGNQYND